AIAAVAHGVGQGGGLPEEILHQSDPGRVGRRISEGSLWRRAFDRLFYLEEVRLPETTEGCHDI
ncbi:MAG: hypothetical protein WCG26_14205, partial [Chloroflexales bacterium]